MPRNNSNCVPEGEQFSVSCIVFNPHDNFTNLSVSWFKSTTANMSNSEMIHTSITMAMVGIPMGNCRISQNLYRDQFFVQISNFTASNDGYYWCQMSINNTFVQPSHHAFFYSSPTNCDIRHQYFRSANLDECECARYLNISSAHSLMAVTSTTISSATTLIHHETKFNTIAKKSPTVSSQSDSLALTTTATRYKIQTAATSKTSSLATTRLSTIALTVASTQQEIPIIKRSRPLVTYYVAASLSAVVLTLGALVIVLSIMYLCKFRRREPSKFYSLIVFIN